MNKFIFNKIDLEYSFSLLKCFFNRIGFAPFCGFELEFYAIDESVSVEELEKIFGFLSFFHCIKKERGKNQFEYVTKCSSDICGLIEELYFVREFLKKKGFLFNSKPFLGDYGSSFQMNFSLFDEKNNNVFLCDTECLHKIVAGILYYMKNNMLFYAPTVFSFDRFKYSDHYTPSVIGWSNNNRKTSVRIKKKLEL
ncbi:hypothetical protein GUI12_00390 [Anaplasmataceae bacterium AB001_6]|nr:hypothetical protein GUI12_00390 [Anaplasmataceae bacterium AB001_6]